MTKNVPNQSQGTREDLWAKGVYLGQVGSYIG